jgi:hypothetical protein
MANIIFSKCQILKPPPGAQINFGYPLAQDLTALLLFNEGAGQATNLMPQDPVTEQNSPTWGTSQAGGLVKIASATNMNWKWADPTRLLVLDRATILFIRRFTDTTLRASATFGVDDPASAFGHRCGAHVPFSDGNVYWDFGGVTGANRISFANAKSLLPESWAFRAGSLGSSIWLNGQKKASQGTAITRTSTSSLAFYVNGGNNTTIVGDFQEFFFFAVYKTELPDAAIQQWMADPFCMLMPSPPISRRIFLPAIGGAASGPNSFMLRGAGV